MRNEVFARSLRLGLEAWEQEAAASWDRLTRSPEFLSRVGYQLTASLQSQQRIAAALQSIAVQVASSRQQAARELYLLERLQKQIDTLAARIAQLESSLDER
jgi:hypothetical protein